jgi:hypothetical protein
MIIKMWDNLLLRGSRSFRASQHPICLIQVTLLDQTGQPVFKYPLWLGVAGKHRHKLNPIKVYLAYIYRFRIEHFFRFCKQRLLLTRYQTFNSLYEEMWWSLCFLVYAMLYLARSYVLIVPEPWERYLPCHRHPIPGAIATPSQTQRGLTRLLETIGTPARPCIPRGKAPGRKPGNTQPERLNQPILYKSQSKKPASAKSQILPKASVPAASLPDPSVIPTPLPDPSVASAASLSVANTHAAAAKMEQNPILWGFEQTRHLPNPQRIQEIIRQLHQVIGTAGISSAEFAEMLTHADPEEPNTS